jgi:3-chloro-4-hydroxyphenylacetate reductive dehalogenase
MIKRPRQGPYQPFDIVGPITRLDERDTAFSKAIKGRLGPVMKKRMRDSVPDALWRIFYPRRRRENSVFWFLFDAADGPVNPDRKELSDPVANARHIKEIARRLGADLVGVSELKPDFVYTNYGNIFDYPKGRLGEPITLAHRYAISVAKGMDRRKLNASPSYIENAETGLRYAQLALITCMLAAYIRELGYPAKAHHLVNEEILQQPPAIMAGLGELGRNDTVISARYGPAMRLGTVTTDLPLALDEPIHLGVKEFCEQCGKCADNCPSRAISHGPPRESRGIRKWNLRGDRCLNFWNSNPQFWSSCANCLKSCPYNKPWKWWHRVALKSTKYSRVARKALLCVDDVLYGRNPMYSTEVLGYRYPRPVGAKPKPAEASNPILPAPTIRR